MLVSHKVEGRGSSRCIFCAALHSSPLLTLSRLSDLAPHTRLATWPDATVLLC